MTSPKVKSGVVAVVTLALVTANLVVFTRTSTFECPEGQTYTLESKSRGLPLAYWRWQQTDMVTPSCEFPPVNDSHSTFLLLAALVNLIVAGAVLVGTHAVLDYKRGKK